MTQRTLTAEWQEGPGADPELEPAIDANGQRRIVVAVSDPNYPDGYVAYAPNDDLTAAQTALAIQSALGRPT